MSKKLPLPSPDHFSPFMCSFLQFLASEYERIGHKGEWSPYAAYTQFCRDGDWKETEDGGLFGEFVPYEFAVPRGLDQEVFAEAVCPVDLWCRFAADEAGNLLRSVTMREVPDYHVTHALNDVRVGLHEFCKAFPSAYPEKQQGRRRQQEQDNLQICVNTEQ